MTAWDLARRPGTHVAKLATTSNSTKMLQDLFRQNTHVDERCLFAFANRVSVAGKMCNSRKNIIFLFYYANKVLDIHLLANGTSGCIGIHQFYCVFPVYLSNARWMRSLHTSTRETAIATRIMGTPAKSKNSAAKCSMFLSARLNLNCFEYHGCLL